MGVLLLPPILGFAGIVAYGKWRYEVTVVVETPEGLKKGSAVRQLSSFAIIDLLNIPHFINPPSFKGEAVVVNLDERGYLFAILGVSPYSEFYQAYSNPFGKSTPRGISYYNYLLWGSAKQNIKPLYYPQMVMFEDINDPMTVRLVYDKKRDPKINKKWKQINNLEEIFGDGVSIKSIKIKKTIKPVTRGEIVKVLPWLSNDSIRGGYLHGKSSSRGAPLGLHGGRFKR